MITGPTFWRYANLERRHDSTRRAGRGRLHGHPKIVGNYGQHQGGVLKTDIKGASPGSGFDPLQ
ncbi:MAG: hypothetical protein M3R38_21020, partial [Actinomycetota bacterium]|nr:hypothetical protein [Actinomycetota bacterium]